MSPQCIEIVAFPRPALIEMRRFGRTKPIPNHEEIKRTETQIFSSLKEADTSLKFSEVCFKQGISQPTHYSWKSKYGDTNVAELERL